MKTTLHFSPDAEYCDPVIQSDESHQVKVTLDAQGDHVLVECSSRESLLELGRALIQEALFGTGDVEFYPLIHEGKALVVNGVRLSKESARLFVQVSDREKNAL